MTTRAESVPVWTSKDEGHRDAKEIAGLRPMAASKPRVPRKPSEKPRVSSGIVCFCGERFGESDALEFMKHLRAEVGEDLALLEKRRAYFRRYQREQKYRDPEAYAHRLELQRERARRRRRDPEWRAKKNASVKAWRDANRVQYDERNCRNCGAPFTPKRIDSWFCQTRCRTRYQVRVSERKRRARKKAEREAENAS